MVATALSSAVNFAPSHGARVMDLAFRCLPPGATTITLAELGKHDIIEHDVSFSRDDAAFGDALHLSPEIWLRSKAILRNADAEAIRDEKLGDIITLKSLARAKHARMMASRAKHEKLGKPFSYGLILALVNYTEMASILMALGDKQKGVVRAEYVDIWFGEYP